MAKLPLPERGQPLDVTYIYELVKTVNDLSTEVSSAAYNFTSIDNGPSIKETVKTSNARVVGGYVEIFTNSIVSAGNEKYRRNSCWSKCYSCFTKTNYL
jgi:hypothetical protein